MQFTIVVPTFNRPKQLTDCLRAMTALDYPREHFETIVVDDGSAASLDAVIKPFCAQMNVRLLKQANAGPAAARNTGAVHARGRFLAFTDDDCAPAPNWLAVLERELTVTPNRMVGGRIVNVLTDNVYASASQLIVDLVYAYYNADALNARFCASNNLALPTEAFRALGGFEPTFRTSEDRDLCDRWLHAGQRLVYAADAVVYHAHHLTLRAFWRQHFDYGRGAFRFNRAHARRGATDSTLKPNFYLETLRRLPRVLAQYPRRRAVTLAMLLVVWQMANTLGFVAEATKTRFADWSV